MNDSRLPCFTQVILEAVARSLELDSQVQLAFKPRVATSILPSLPDSMTL